MKREYFKILTTKRDVAQGPRGIINLDKK